MMKTDYRNSWVSRQNGTLAERENGLRKYDHIKMWTNPNPAAVGMHYLESAAKYAEITFPDGTINPVCHAVAVFDELPRGLKLLKETGHLGTSKRVGMLLKRTQDALKARGCEYHQDAFRHIVEHYATN